MGCDIHMYVEKRTETGWKAVKPPPGWDPWIEEHGYDLGYEWNPERNYRMFARLADVRNHDRVVQPIAAPRGLPADVSVEIAKENAKAYRGNSVAGIGLGWHSESWFLSVELRDQLWPLHGQQWSKLLWKFHDDPDIRFVFWFDN